MKKAKFGGGGKMKHASENNGKPNPHVSRIIVLQGPRPKEARKSKGRRKASWM